MIDEFHYNMGNEYKNFNVLEDISIATKNR